MKAAKLNFPQQEDAEPIVPFLKWPGGKRWFVQRYAEFLPKNFNRYFEPFLGGGSVFFYLKPARAILGDVNPDVINVYRSLKRDWRYIQRSLQHHQRAHSERHYYRTRDFVPKDKDQQASRTLYLNRTCFNGIYRVNLDGEFNVPKGDKEDVLLDSDNFKSIAALLKRAKIYNSDFMKLVDMAEKDDLVFADPPYTVRHNMNGFVKYNETLFSWGDQERLAEALIRAKNRGVKIVSTNANHQSIINLYRSAGFYLQAISRYSSISASAESRKQFEELIIMSHPQDNEG